MSSAWVVGFVHLLVTVVYVGGMIFMKLVLFPSLEVLGPPERGRVLGAVAKRFTAVAWGSMALLLVTGLMKTPKGLLSDTTSGVGRLLLAKHVLFGVMVLVGALITFVFAPRLAASAPAAGSPPGPGFAKAQKAIEALSATNTVLAVAILAIVVAF